LENSLNSGISPPCRYLGLRDDPDAFYSYPSTGNLCHHCRRPVSPLLAHQEAYCLTGAHENCPAFLQAPTKSFPAELRAEEPRHSVRPTAIGTALAIGIVLAALGFGILRVFPNLVTDGLQLLQELPAVMLPLATAANAPSVATMMPSTAACATPASTLVPSSIAPSLAGTHALEVPIEVDGRELILHRVGSGETFETISAKYQTAAAAIRSLNYSMGASLFASSVIVIEPGQQTIDTALPSFLTHRVGDAPAISIDQVAAQYNVSAALMRRYNGCTYDCELVASDWVMIPVLQK
jgi:hypothetical protein